MMPLRTVVCLFAVACTNNALATCIDGVQPGGAKYRLCMPASGSWNQQLVLYARSFVPANESASIPENELTLPDGTNLPSVFNQLGYAFAVSSYRSTGLAILPALEDLKELVDIAATRIGQPTKIYLT